MGADLFSLLATLKRGFARRNMSDYQNVVLTREVLDKVYDIVREHGATVVLVLGSFKRYGMLDRKLVDVALKELQRERRIMEWPLNAPPPEESTT